jgi:hypothetical protein
MLTKNFHQLQTKVSAHVEADQVRRGSYKTCFIGCLAKQRNSPEFIQSEYGIPLAVSRIAEAIFEGLPLDEAPLFFAAFPGAVKSDGKDLSLVCWQFLAAELRSLPPVTPEVQAAINPVIDGMDLLSEGKEWPEEDANAAARAARAASAADSAANAAANAAYWAANAAYCAANAAYWAANAAANTAYCAANAAANAAYWAARATGLAARAEACYRRQRDLLLRLIKEAPITQQENNS